MTSPTPLLHVLDLGRAAYAPTLALQERLVAALRAALRAAPGGGDGAGRAGGADSAGETNATDRSRDGWLLLLEHDPPVLTLGRRAQEGHVLASRERLARLGIEVHEVSRGGDVTYHGPGQLVAYLILRLDRHGRDVHLFMRNLEESVIRVLARYGVAGGRVEGLTGVWVGHEKVAAAGVAITRWVTYHGIALNVCPQMDHFGLIVPCGIRDHGVTSLSALAGREVSVAEVRPLMAECVAEVFGFGEVDWCEGPPTSFADESSGL
jgi:lipoate-protein ligase B